MDDAGTRVPGSDEEISMRSDVQGFESQTTQPDVDALIDTSHGLLQRADDASTDAALAAAGDRDVSESVDVPERFAVRDPESASWVIRKIVEARAYAERVRRSAEAELRRAERVEQWLLWRF